MSACQRLLRTAMYVLLAILSLHAYAAARAQTPASSVPSVRQHQSAANAADDEEDDDDDEDEDEDGDDDGK